MKVEVNKMKRIIEIRYEKKSPICSDYHRFYIRHDTDKNGNYQLLKQTSWGDEPVIKPNGTFDDENLARLVLDYIETQKGYEKCDEHLYFD